MHKYKRAIVAHIGPMYGGKTSGLLSDVRKMRIAGYKVALFKPMKDERYSLEDVVNHDGESLVAVNVITYQDIMDYLHKHSDVDVIAIDEFQFIKCAHEEHHKKFSDGEIGFNEWTEGILKTKRFAKWVIETGRTLILSGLDLDSELNPFDNTKEILPYATHIFKHKAVCTSCGNDATTSYCKVEKNSQEQIGGKDMYEPLCLNCYTERKGSNYES